MSGLAKAGILCLVIWIGLNILVPGLVASDKTSTYYGDTWFQLTPMQIFLPLGIGLLVLSYIRNRKNNQS